MLLRPLTLHQLTAACFPIAGYATRAGYWLFIRPPQPFAGPPEYVGQGRTCFEALAAAVQLFHDSAHAYPGARFLAAPGSHCPPQLAQPFPHDDEPADEVEALYQYEMRLAYQQARPNC